MIRTTPSLRGSDYERNHDKVRREVAESIKEDYGEKKGPAKGGALTDF